MALTVFFSTPFIQDVTSVDQIDTLVGDGSEDTFPLVNKTYLRMGAVAQVGTVDYFLYTSGFTKNPDDTITFADTPLAGVQGILPGLGATDLMSYDQSVVDGVSNPLVGTTSIFFGDIEEIYSQKYLPRSGAPGIEILFVNNITGGGLPDLSWVSASSGNAATWTASGVSLYTDKLSGFSTVAASSNSGLNTLLVNSATGDDYFILNDYLIINIGNPTAEIVRLSSKSYNLLTFSSSFNYPHYVDEPVFSCLRQIDLRQIVPEDFTSNNARNYYNISYKIKANQVQRS